MTTQAKYWSGNPTHCDMCHQPLQGYFVDGRMYTGQWAILCQPCHNSYGYGLGTGRGQAYTQQANNKWLKTGG